ncbi:acetokinase family protein [Burkholderia mallei]|nr:acetokinase family protein [Burkholderia mallei]
MSEPLLLTFNAGSSTLKIGLYSVANGEPAPLGRGKIDFNRAPLQFEYANGGEAHAVPLAAPVTDDLHAVLDEALGWIDAHLSVHELVSVGHRVVHGGDTFDGPVRIDERTLDAIAALVPLAPLHQPQSVRLIRALRHVRPHLPQVASFDTAFHRTQSDLVRRFALPRALFDAGIKRYGFHGLSYRYVAGRLRERHPSIARGKVVAAHLGSGDLPPTNRASRSLVKFVFGEEDEHEEALYGTANHRVSEGSRGQYAGQGTVQEAWVQ